VKNSTSNLNSKDIFPVRWVYGGLIATTLFFYTTANDPFNSPQSKHFPFLSAGNIKVSGCPE
jgi:hypothetical protein